MAASEVSRFSPLQGGQIARLVLESDGMRGAMLKYVVFGVRRGR